MGFTIVVPPGIPFSNKPQFPPPPPPASSANSFPILAITILGILTTAILLLSYYVFVIKCCLIWHRSDVIARLSRSSRRRHLRRQDLIAAAYSTYPEGRGLEESVIRAIPTFRYTSGTGGDEGGKNSRSSFHECAVCLNEFQEEERVRLLPGCLHVFHIDCIDVWLQTHATCPLCRAEITAQAGHRTTADSVVIQVRDEAAAAAAASNTTTSPPSTRAARKLRKVPSMGDELVDSARRKEEQGPVMRRSFSMDSSGDRQLYLAVQEILRQNPHFREIGSSDHREVRRPFFSFGRSRSRTSQSSVLPVHNPE